MAIFDRLLLFPLNMNWKSIPTLSRRKVYFAISFEEQSDIINPSGIWQITYSFYSTSYRTLPRDGLYFLTTIISLPFLA